MSLVSYDLEDDEEHEDEHEDEHDDDDEREDEHEDEDEREDEHEDEDEREDEHEDEREDVHEDEREDVHKDEREDVHQDEREDVHQDEREAVHQDEREAVHQDERKDVHQDQREDEHEHEDEREDEHEPEHDDPRNTAFDPNDPITDVALTDEEQADDNVTGPDRTAATTEEELDTDEGGDNLSVSDAEQLAVGDADFQGSDEEQLPANRIITVPPASTITATRISSEIQAPVSLVDFGAELTSEEEEEDDHAEKEAGAASDDQQTEHSMDISPDPNPAPAGDRQDPAQSGVVQVAPVVRTPDFAASSLSRSVRLLNPNQIQLPPEPPGRCSPRLQEKIKGITLEKSRRNSTYDMNRKIQDNKNFRNPSIYEKLIAYLNIDEKGTNFPPEVYNPYRWESHSFFDELARVQNKEVERLDKLRKEQHQRKVVEFVTGTRGRQPGSGGGVTSSTTTSEEIAKKRTKWDSVGPHSTGSGSGGSSGGLASSSAHGTMPPPLPPHTTGAPPLFPSASSCAAPPANDKSSGTSVGGLIKKK